ncbi:methyltransferase family protein [Mycolicibacterium goodii]|uniref:Isoprenylcysteine carboxylmethyltransferase family protein n=1 Tax=Mycolicibacterium goodii TaxID=134601 RepID=A0ABS6HKM6_MYCGD|nr:isoprenylcysteine carboxylmethyltransferase family protein [Mycolicibacterium goodii]OKH61535.1 membrane protein [Mycobacterium sp. SWH-M5]MBU8818351.1 isoprenylcysteine carboxylmethyltransferase family protein [Mycolicibacterium goodii]MBU8823243.1 isoprenylcysteine carboxylmethyltransferase family protein [Mycolicibacterium goodii]MBU8833458.1 isoprenylcysteine carboxylmethyltransferase family protein [Mycolicibacterium goodii]MBU8840687.1 isoprenylcysteine carboxylmethyltransferase famil
MKLFLQSVASGIFGLAFFAVALLWPAGTFDYWQAWVFIAVFLAATMIPSFYLAVTDPTTLQRRLHAGPTAETRITQKVAAVAIVVLVLAVLIVCALDRRFGWSTVPTWLVLVGDVVMGVSLVLSQVVIFQNRFAAATIRVEAEQQVVSTGMYGWVRHPMYLWALVMMFATPLALGSFWGLLVVTAALPILGLRILDEEKMLSAELRGYDEYRRTVQYRLVPGVW